MRLFSRRRVLPFPVLLRTELYESMLSAVRGLLGRILLRIEQCCRISEFVKHSVLCVHLRRSRNLLQLQVSERYNQRMPVDGYVRQRVLLLRSRTGHYYHHHHITGYFYGRRLCLRRRRSLLHIPVLLRPVQCRHMLSSVGEVFGRILLQQLRMQLPNVWDMLQLQGCKRFRFQQLSIVGNILLQQLLLLRKRPKAPSCHVDVTGDDEVIRMHDNRMLVT